MPTLLGCHPPSRHARTPPRLLQQVFNRLYKTDGAVTGIPTSEFSDKAYAVPANNSTYLGCLLGDDAVMDGIVLGTLSDVPTAEECCRRCRAWLADSGGKGMQCNVWNYCNTTRGPEGCRCAFGGRGIPAGRQAVCN